MDFLKSAVASAIAKGPPFPYSFGDRVDLEPSIWTLYNGTRREDGTNCSIFSFDVTANKARLPLARNAVKKLRTMRHPGVLKVLDTVETETYIYMATERVVPLRWHLRRKSLSPETLKWGLFNVARTLKFINDEAASVHGALKVASVFTSESGEWKLGGFEVLSSAKDDEAVVYTYGSLVPDAARYTPPELARNGWDAIKRAHHWAPDAFAFGVLIFEAFNGEYTGPDQAGQTRNVPPAMQTGYKRLVNANPKARISVGNLLEMGQRRGSFFDSPLIKLTDGIENLGVKTPEEREAFLDDLSELTDDVPEDFFKMKVLPELLTSVEFGGGGPKALALVVSIAAKLSNDDFEARVTPVMVRLFANPDRAIRVSLLDNLPHMIDRFSNRTVSDKIFPHIVGGFTDVAPVVREQTLKSVLVFVPKLSERTVNGELLRLLAKTANDEQPGIRTNTTICLGKMAKHLSPSSRGKVLIAAFSRSLRDPFVHARNAALLALAATVDCYSPDDAAARVLPAICAVLLDREKLVRDQALKTMDAFLQKVAKAAAAMPESVLPPPAVHDRSQTAGAGAGASQSATPRMGTPQPDAAGGSAAGWAGWAISSFTNKMAAAAGEIEPAVVPTPSMGLTPAATPPPGATTTRPKPNSLTTASASNLHRQAVRSPSASQPLSPASTGDSFFGGDGGGGGDDADNDNADDAWGAMDDGFGGGDGDAWDDANGDTNTNDETNAPAKTTSRAVRGTVKPFGDDAEPDFAGWLAAQESKKKGALGGKALPKGLGKAGTGTASVARAAAKPAAKPVAKPKKKIDLAPKNTADDDWGDGW